MALTKCEDCGGKVSSKAKACPHCGCPLEQNASDSSSTLKDELLKIAKEELMFLNGVDLVPSKPLKEIYRGDCDLAGTDLVCLLGEWVEQHPLFTEEIEKRILVAIPSKGAGLLATAGDCLGKWVENGVTFDQYMDLAISCMDQPQQANPSQPSGQMTDAQRVAFIQRQQLIEEQREMNENMGGF